MTSDATGDTDLGGDRPSCSLNTLASRLRGQGEVGSRK